MLKAIQSTIWPNLHSRSRWLRLDSFAPEWGARAALAAKFIEPHSSVVDIGCGRMQLREHLPPECAYTPADMKQWTEDVLEIDLNAGRFPPGTYDYAVVLGVLEYLYRPSALFDWARGACAKLIISYEHPRPGQRFWHRRRYGWVNDITAAALCRDLERCGWRVADQAKWKQQDIYYCMHSR